MTNEVVAKADRFSAALNIVQRNAERKKVSVLDSVTVAIDSTVLTPEEQAEQTEAQEAVWNADGRPILG